MVFITAGMGGGTGTGGAPVIARVARELGILTIGVVTKPFHFEGSHRMKIAEAGIEELQKFVDTLIIIPNQNLFRVANERTTFADAFKMADDVLHSGVRGVTDLMVMPGLINLDFADIRTVMSEMGKAMMGTGDAEGDRRAIDAAEAAISNPLLEDVSMKGAKGVLINITGGPDMTLFEVDEAANRIREEVDPDANIIFGSTFDETLSGKMRISVVATGIDAEAMTQARPAISLVSSRETGAATALREATTGGYTQPVLTQNAAQSAGASGRAAAESEALPPAAVTAETAAMRGDAFIAPKPVDAGPARPIPLTQPAVPVTAADARSGAKAQRPGAEPDRARHRCRPGALGAAGTAAPADPARRQTGATAARLARTGGSAGLERGGSPRYSRVLAAPGELMPRRVRIAQSNRIRQCCARVRVLAHRLKCRTRTRRRLQPRWFGYDL